MLNGFFDWFLGIFGLRREIRFGIYGEVNTGKTTLANKISMDWTGSPVGKVSEIPHETRAVQRKEKVELKLNKKKVMINLLDMPGLATKIDYRSFLKFGLNKKAAKARAREATDGVIE